MGQLHAPLKMPRRQTHKRHAVAVFRVHIGLHLEHKAGHSRLFRGHIARRRFLHLRLGAIGCDPVHQFLDAKTVHRRAEPDRRHRAIKQGLRIKGREQLLGHLDLFKELGQQRRRHMFLELRIIQTLDRNRRGDLVSIRTVHQFQLIAQNVIAADKLAADPNRPTCRGHVNRQILLNFVNDLKGIAALAVHFVTKRQDRQVAQAAHLKQLLGLAFHTLSAVNHHHGGINSRQRAVGILGEIRVAGSIHQIETVIAKIKRHRRGAHGNPAVLFHLHKVGAGAARLTLGTDLTSHLNSATIKEEFFGQRRLPSVGVRNNRKGPTAGNFRREFWAICHARSHNLCLSKGQSALVKMGIVATLAIHRCDVHSCWSPPPNAIG